MLESVLGFAREGFAEVNAVLGLLVAVVATLMMTAWARLPFVAVGATLAHNLERWREKWGGTRRRDV